MCCLTEFGGIFLGPLFLTFSKVFSGKTQSTPSIAAEHRLITNDIDLQRSLPQEIYRPIVVVNKDPRYVNFWKTVCSDGKNFTTLVEIGGKRFQSPWAMLGFRGLHNALILSEDEPADGDLEFLEMQEALDDYVAHHRLFAQAEAASRLASRLPWLVKYKFVESLPWPIHVADLDRVLRKATGSLPNKDVTFKLPQRYIIATLLVAGHMMETHFNHWIAENVDLEVGYTSLGGAFRKLFAKWEMESRTFKSCRGDSGMKEINEVREFLGDIRYTQKADTKFRDPGVNTSFWEAALAGPVPRTAAHAVLASQQPNTITIGGSVLSVSSTWFAKIRASNLLGNRIFERPYDDFPFPRDIIPVSHLTETEQRLAYAQKELPQFELVQLQFGPYRALPSFQQLFLDVVPTWPSPTRRMTTGRFQQTYLLPESPPEKPTPIPCPPSLPERKSNADTNSRLEAEETADTQSGVDANTEVGGQLKGWRSIDPPLGGDRVLVARGNDSALQAFVDALRASGVSANLEDVKEIAGSQGWDQASFANMRDLGNLCEHFQVGLTLENELTGCIKYSVEGASASVPSVRLVYLGDMRFAWIREQNGETVKVQTKRRVVRFGARSGKRSRIAESRYRTGPARAGGFST